MAKDEADIAAEQEEHAREEAFYRVRRANTFRHGTCYNCGEAVPGSFCDADCRRDYEHRREVAAHTRAG